MASPASRPAAGWATSWTAVSALVLLLSVLGWGVFSLSPALLAILIAVLALTAVLVLRWLATVEASVMRHVRVFPDEISPASHSSTVDDGARALVEGAAFQNIATSLVYAYCTPYGANVIKSRLNDQLRSTDVAIEELRFGSHIPVTRVLSQPSMERGELHLSLSIEWDFSDGAIRILLRRFNVQIEVRMSKVQLQGTVVVASTKAPWEVRFHASSPVFVDLKPSMAFGQLPSIRLDMLTPIASRCLLIATAPFLKGRYAHQWSDALGLEQLLAWSAEKLPRTSVTEPLFAVLRDLATHPSFPFGSNAARFKARQEYIASAALAAFDVLKIAKQFIDDKTVQTPQELLNVVKSADKCLLACLTASDEMQVLGFFPQPSLVSQHVLSLYRLLGLSPILAEALSGIERRATTQSVSFPHGDGTQEGSFVLLKPKPNDELPKVLTHISVRRFETPAVNVSKAVARTLLQSAARPSLFLCVAPDGAVSFEPAPAVAATVWLVLFYDLAQRSFLLVAEDSERFLSVRDGMLMCSRTERGTWYWLDRRADSEIFASFSTGPEGDGLLISSASAQALEAAPAGKDSWLRFVDCPPPPVVQQEP